MEPQTQPQAPPKKNRPRWGRRAAWTALIALLALTTLALLRAQQGSLSKGQPAPAFSVTTFDGQEITLESLRGKVVLVNFWASWCIPCANEADDLEEAWQYYKDRGDVVFLGIAWSDMDSKAQAYIAQYDTSYLNAPDSGTRASQAYRITGVPETFVIDQNGVLQYTKFVEFSSPEQIIAAIDPLLK
jgi:cytochrome c biogenesis protein CcmG/thiol:disulfide interchange protein DsbE